MRNTSDIKYFGEVLKWLKSLASNTSRSVTRREGSNPSFSAEKERKTFFSSCALFHISIIHYKSSRYWISQTDLPLHPLISRIMLTATITAPTIKITSPMFCPAKSIQLWKFTPGLTTLLLLLIKRHSLHHYVFKYFLMQAWSIFEYIWWVNCNDILDSKGIRLAKTVYYTYN